MSASRVSAAAGVVRAAMEQGRRTAAGISVALESAGLLQSPESAAELTALRAQVAAVRAFATSHEYRWLHELLDGQAGYTYTAPGPDAEAEPYVSRILPRRDAVCACGHTGLDHHHGGTKCWAHLPMSLGDPIRICECAKFSEAPAVVPEPAPLVVYRASHDSIDMGIYTTREAAREHCEAYVRREEPEGSILHLSWWTEDVADDEATYELHVTPAAVGSTIRATGYVVTPLTVASAYDPDAEE
ncbi:hypothetical protein [Streptomyces hebeiensis]